MVRNDQIVKSSANTKAMQYGKCAVCTADSRLLIPERIIGVRNCARYSAAESKGITVEPAALPAFCMTGMPFVCGESPQGA